MMTKTEKDKLAFIDATQTAIDAVVDPILVERMKTYHEQFGSFSRVDVRLWDSCRIAYNVAFQAAIEMDVDEDD